MSAVVFERRLGRRHPHMMAWYSHGNVPTDVFSKSALQGVPRCGCMCFRSDTANDVIGKQVIENNPVVASCVVLEQEFEATRAFESLPASQAMSPAYTNPGDEKRRGLSHKKATRIFKRLFRLLALRSFTKPLKPWVRGRLPWCGSGSDWETQERGRGGWFGSTLSLNCLAESFVSLS